MPDEHRGNSDGQSGAMIKMGQRISVLEETVKSLKRLLDADHKRLRALEKAIGITANAVDLSNGETIRKRMRRLG